MPKVPASTPSDIVVIGAGIVGCAIAYELAARGAAVTIVDDRPAGDGATQASAGMLAPFAEATGEGPLFDMGARSLALYDRFVAVVHADSGVTVPYARTGSLHVARTAGAVSALERTHGLLGRRGVESSMLSPHDARVMEPPLASDVRGALFIPSHGHVSQLELTHALSRAAARRGARTTVARVTQVGARPGRGVRVETSSGRLEAGGAVLAAGAWSSTVAVAGAPAAPVEPVRGQLLHLAWSDGAPGRIVWNERCYVVPRAGGTVLVGATVERVGFDERTTVAGVRDLLDAVSELLPRSAGAGLIGARVGLRPGTPDELPILGWSAAVPGLMYATGHYRNGVLLAPLTAQLVAAAMLDGTGDAALEATRPSRFGAL